MLSPSRLRCDRALQVLLQRDVLGVRQRHFVWCSVQPAVRAGSKNDQGDCGAKPKNTSCRSHEAFLGRHNAVHVGPDLFRIRCHSRTPPVSNRNDRDGRRYVSGRCGFRAHQSQDSPSSAELDSVVSILRSRRTIWDPETPRPQVRRQSPLVTSASRHCPALPILRKECAIW